MSEFILHIEDATIVNTGAVRKFFNELRDGKYLVKITSIKRRSLNQNAFYWSVVCELVKDALREAGYREVKTKDDAHEIMKTLFLKKKVVNELTDEVIEIPGSTAELTTVQFIEYIGQIQQWASEYLGLVLPEPSSQSKLFQ